MSSFLDNLKNAVEKGEFNSDAAKKINEIHEMAENKTNFDEVKENYKKRVEEDKEKIEPLSDSERKETESEYQEKMSYYKKVDGINNEIARLDYLDNKVIESVTDIIDRVEYLEKELGDSLKSDEMYGDLLNKINEIREKYK